jgi:hypothetical protein
MKNETGLLPLVRIHQTGTSNFPKLTSNFPNLIKRTLTANLYKAALRGQTEKEKGRGIISGHKPVASDSTIFGVSLFEKTYSIEALNMR